MIVQELYFDDHFKYADEDGQFWCEFGDTGPVRHRATLIITSLGEDSVICCAAHQNDAQTYFDEQDSYMGDFYGD